MAIPNILSDGAIGAILNNQNMDLTPIVQILGTKMMANSRLRAVITDGTSICQHCIFVSENALQMANDGLLGKFAVVQLNNYTTQQLPKNETRLNMTPVILVSGMDFIKSGTELNRKLNAGEPFRAAGDGGDDTLNASQELMPPPIMPVQPRMSLDRNNNPTRASTSSYASAPVPAPSPPPPTQSLKSATICPLNVVTPFFNAWVIRVRVTNKTPIKEWKNARGEGKLFSFDVTDESGEIRVTAFSAECDRFFNVIEKDRIYFISRGACKAANRKYSSLNNDYEITLNSSTVIEECNDAIANSVIPKMRYKFVPLASIACEVAGTMLDIIGVVRLVTPLEALVSRRTKKELVKRDVSIVDKSLTEARITIWNETANDFAGQPGQILALKGAIVGEFKGNKQISTGISTIIELEPVIAETLTLRTWYDSEGVNKEYNQLMKPTDGSKIATNTRLMCQIIPRSVVDPAKSSYYQMIGIIHATNRFSQHLYKACSNKQCRKKLDIETHDANSGVYHCNKCDLTALSFDWRLMLSLMVVDCTGNHWVSLFGEQGEKLLGKSSAELAELYENNLDAYTAVINSIRFKQYRFRIAVKLDTYGGDTRLRLTVQDIYPIQSVDRAKRLMTIIDALSTQLNG